MDAHFCEEHIKSKVINMKEKAPNTKILWESSKTYAPACMINDAFAPAPPAPNERIKQEPKHVPCEGC